MTAPLTKKNDAYVRQFEKLLRSSGKLSEPEITTAVNDITNQILVGQPKGQTANQLLGTPTQAAQQYAPTTTGKPGRKKLHEYDVAPLVIDTAMAIFILFGVVFGLSGLFAPQAAGNTGITSLVLIAIFGGIVYTRIILALTPNPAKPNQMGRNKRWALLGVAMLLWIVGFMGLSLIPTAINPILPGWVYLLLAVVAFGIFRWNRQRSGLSGGFFAISQLSMEARREAEEARK
jgi:uncharacterized membrane-anchored protein